MNIIRGFRRTLDFYLWMGIPCVRMWPQSKLKTRSKAVMQGWTPFTIATQEWNNLDPVVRAAYDSMTQNSDMTGRDLQIRSYLSGLFTNPLL